MNDWNVALGFRPPLLISDTKQKWAGGQITASGARESGAWSAGAPAGPAEPSQRGARGPRAAKGGVSRGLRLPPCRTGQLDKRPAQQERAVPSRAAPTDTPGVNRGARP